MVNNRRHDRKYESANCRAPAGFTRRQNEGMRPEDIVEIFRRAPEKFVSGLGDCSKGHGVLSIGSSPKHYESSRSNQVVCARGSGKIGAWNKGVSKE